MKAYRTGKIHYKEFARLKEIGYNYHKFLWTKFKRKIATKRLN
jgi:hypothetical protein